MLLSGVGHHQHCTIKLSVCFEREWWVACQLIHPSKTGIKATINNTVSVLLLKYSSYLQDLTWKATGQGRTKRRLSMTQQVSSKPFKRLRGAGLEGKSVLYHTLLYILQRWKAISAQIWKLLELHNSSQHKSLIWFCQSDANFTITSIKTFRSPLFYCYLIAPELSVSHEEWLRFWVRAELFNRWRMYNFISFGCRIGWQNTSLLLALT